MDDSRLEELTASVKQMGILQTLLVTPKGDQYILVVGQRRLVAAKQAGLSEVPCLSIPDLTDNDIMLLSFIENIQRESLTPLEEARGIRRLMEEASLTYREVGALLGISKSSSQERVSLLDLPEDLQQAVEHNGVSMKKALALKGVADPAVRAKLLAKTTSGDLVHFRDLINQQVARSDNKRQHLPQSQTAENLGVSDKLLELCQNLKGTRLYKGRISFKFRDKSDLRSSIRQVLTVLA